MKSEAPDDGRRLLDRDPRALEEDTRGRLHRSGPFDQPPLLRRGGSGR